MMYFFSYQEVKQLTEERRARSLAEYQRRQPPPLPRLLTKDTQTDEAEVIELSFGTQCESDQIGA